MHINRRTFLTKTSLAATFTTLGYASTPLSANPGNDPGFLQETVYLWAKGSRNDLPTEESERPKIVVYYAKNKPRQTQAAILICPGGSYRSIAEDHEGDALARFFAGHGITSAVLFYRHRDHKHPAPYADACRAMRLMRKNATKYNIDPQRVGIMGFSAGGHLASTVATQPNMYKDQLDDLASSVSARPDRAILCYPVISLMEYAHTGSRDNLLGLNADPKLIAQLSNQTQVTADTPPTFLFHTADDATVPVQNSLMFAEACVKNKVPVALHVFPSGKHGVGMAPDNPELRVWTDNLISWLSSWTLKT